MTARLLLDEMYLGALAERLRGRGHDVTAVVELVEMVSGDDRSVLSAATAQARCLATENVRDFALLVRDTGHAGVVLVAGRRFPRTGIPRLVDAIDRMIVNERLPGKDEVTWLT